MPRSFDMSADYEGSVEEVHRAFYEADYWKARLAETPVDVATLESIRVGGDSGDDGTIEVVTLQMVRSHNLPGLVTQLHRGDLRYGARRPGARSRKASRPRPLRDRSWTLR